MAAFSRIKRERIERKPSAWIVISGVIATSATTPKAKSITASAPRSETQAPIAMGRMKLLVSGPLATPPESKAMAVYSFGTKNESPSERR